MEHRVHDHFFPWIFCAEVQCNTASIRDLCALIHPTNLDTNVGDNQQISQQCKAG